MDFFWGNVFEYFKDRRLGGVFFGTLAVLLVVLLLAALAAGLHLFQYWPYALPGLVVLLLALIWRWVRQMRAQRRNRYKSSPLARDEIAKARSKLTTKPTFKSS